MRTQVDGVQRDMRRTSSDCLLFVVVVFCFIVCVCVFFTNLWIAIIMRLGFNL